MLDENTIQVIIAIGTAIIAIVAVIKNRSTLKEFLNSLMVKGKFYQWRNRRIERKNYKKEQKIRNEKITRDELMDITITISEAIEDIHAITTVMLCMLIQTINKPDNETLVYYMHRRAYNAKYNMKDIERWLNHLWNENNGLVATGKIKELEANIKQLKDNIKKLNKELIN